MENIVRKPYEISLWDDDLIFRVTYFKNGEEFKTVELDSLADFEIIEGATTQVIQYYKERKICTIGSNTMDTPIRAAQGKLVSNVNGSNTLTFNMYMKYYDIDTKTFYDNPFLKLLVNERKVKLKYGEDADGNPKWYDFVIKDIKENSENKTFSYTCKDLFINELSKSGFDIILDAELENNMGNIQYLTEKILDESDWQYKDSGEIFEQTKEEPLYLVKVNQDITGINMKNSEDIVNINGKEIYVFYSIIANKEPYFQFLYREDGKYEKDDDQVIVNSPNYYIENVEYEDINGLALPKFASFIKFASDSRGEKLVRSAKTVFDTAIGRYVNVYKKDGNEYYGYTKTEYITPVAVSTFITNGEGFTSESGWKAGGSDDGDYGKIDLVGFPDLRDDPKAENYRSFLKYRCTNTQQLLFNSGFADYRSSIKTLAEGEKFVLRAKISEADELNSFGRPVSMKNSTHSSNIKFNIATYDLNNGVYTLKDIFFTGAFAFNEGEWFYGSEDKYILSKTSKSYNDLINSKIGIFFEIPINLDIYFENVQFFRYVTYEKPVDDGNEETEIYQTTMAEPGGELFSSAKTRYIYYIKNSDYKSEDDIVPVYDSYEDDPSFIKQYNDNNFEKVRSVTAKESNRFNLIQDLCELFECWAEFNIEHNPNGEIKLDENYRQKKWISFRKYVGQDNFAGFRYGVNLKSIQRTLNSDGIVSKMVVKNNSNEFAPNGFCSIARAQENPIGENFLYNFNYYIQQKLVDFQEVNNDLYLDVSGYLGYYIKLKRLNTEREAWIELQAQLLTDIQQYQANYQTYKLSVDTAEEELRNTEQAIYDLTGYYLHELIEIYEKEESDLSEKEKEGKNWWDQNSLLIKVNKIGQLRSLIAQHTVLRDRELILDENGSPLGGRLYEAEEEFNLLQEKLDNSVNEKRALNLQFYKKYSRFIQEGSWISEDYIDENLYYLDAESTLYTSAQPKVTYSINVLELSQLEGYENYTFNLGDKTYIEDTEFFGWNQNGTPYHEEIVVSENIIELDSPEKNTFKVQNFKTQFEDLFQRITATTQSIEYHTGEYGRAANIVDSNGTISIDTLQSSIANNAIRLENAKDQSVVWDETGITTTSLSNPSEILRIVSGGIFISNDGGATWNTGITGSGINANWLTTGKINTSNINIMNGDFPSFRWDENGISAFEFSINESTGKAYGFNTAKFVRYDQFGLYGINGNSNFNPLESTNNKIGEDKIWDSAHFALTWKGFMLKNDNGSVRITSTDDIQVLSDNKERIKIGRIGEDNYGIRISNRENTVMETDSSGELWLKNRLRIGTDDTSTVEIGYLNTVREDTGIHEIFHAGTGEKEFVVYEDGKMVAQGAEFHGKIYATGGTIGGLEIDSIMPSYEVRIVADNGPSFRNGEGKKILTAKLYRGSTLIEDQVTYQWYYETNPIQDATNNTLEVNWDENGDSIQTYSCEITLISQD